MRRNSATVSAKVGPPAGGGVGEAERDDPLSATPSATAATAGSSSSAAAFAASAARGARCCLGCLSACSQTKQLIRRRIIIAESSAKPLQN